MKFGDVAETLAADTLTCPSSKTEGPSTHESDNDRAEEGTNRHQADKHSITMITLEPDDGFNCPRLSAPQLSLATDSSGPLLDTLYCQVPGCGVELLKSYCIKKRTCNVHLQASAVQLSVDDPTLWRFCQQCGRFEPLCKFDEAKRSCRARLAKRRSGSRSVFVKRSCLPRSSSCHTEHLAATTSSAAATAEYSWDSILPESHQGESSPATDYMQTPVDDTAATAAATADPFDCAIAAFEASQHLQQHQHKPDCGAQAHASLTAKPLLPATLEAAAAEGVAHDTDYPASNLLGLQRTDTCCSVAVAAAAAVNDDAQEGVPAPAEPTWTAFLPTEEQGIEMIHTLSTKHGHTMPILDHEGNAIPPMQQRPQQHYNRQPRRMSSGIVTDSSGSLNGLLLALPRAFRIDDGSNVSLELSGQPEAAAAAAAAAAVVKAEGLDSDKPALGVMQIGTDWVATDPISLAVHSESQVPEPVAYVHNTSHSSVNPAIEVSQDGFGMTHPDSGITGCSPAFAELNINCSASAAAGQDVRGLCMGSLTGGDDQLHVQPVTVGLPQQCYDSIPGLHAFLMGGGDLGSTEVGCTEQEAAAAAAAPASGTQPQQQQQQRGCNSRLQWLVQQVQEELQRCSANDIEHMTEIEVDMLLMAAMSAPTEGGAAAAAGGQANELAAAAGAAYVCEGMGGRSSGVDGSHCSSGYCSNWQQQQQWLGPTSDTQYMFPSSKHTVDFQQQPRLNLPTAGEAHLDGNALGRYSNLELSAPSLFSHESMASSQTAAAASAQWLFPQQQQWRSSSLAVSASMQACLPGVSAPSSATPASLVVLDHATHDGCEYQVQGY